MRALQSVLAFAAASLITSGYAEAPLRVIRTTPDGDAGVLAPISVTFDRPVAGSLDRAVDPRTVLRVEPAVAGRLEWRDPVTIRLVPTAPLRADTRYTVTVDTTFVAMDGSRLEAPARFTFRVTGPTLLGGQPVGPGNAPDQLLPNQRFDLVYSAAVDPVRLAALAHIEAGAVCRGSSTVRLRVVGQRPIASTDDWQLREAGGHDRSRGADSLRRIVTLAPETPLPAGCTANLVAPLEVATDLPQGLARWPFRTYGEFRLTGVRCGGEAFCPRGPVDVDFSTPVRGADVQRSVKLLPGIPFIVRDTASVSTSWTLDAALEPNRSYVVVVDTSARDAFGQRLVGNPAILVKSTGYRPSLTYAFGRQLVERKGMRTLAVQHVNVDTMLALVAPIPDSLEAQFLSRFAWSVGELWEKVEPTAQPRRIGVKGGADRPSVTGLVLPAADASRRGAPTLYAVRVRPAGSSGPMASTEESSEAPVSVVQVTDLGVTARIGTEEGMVWVTGVSDGLARSGVRVVLHAPNGQPIASGVTNTLGTVRLAGFRPPAAADDDDDAGNSGFEGYVSAALGDDRALVAVNRYDPDLSPWNFGVRAAWGDDRYPIAGAVFTERGIYRPGEQLRVKAIVRMGALGTLTAPAPGDSVKWIFADRDGQTVAQRTVALSAFGTSDQLLDIPASAPIGYHSVRIEMRRGGAWRQVAGASYRVAEYRPPEFLVEMTTRTPPAHPGDRFAVALRASYLFGAPMGRAEVRWTARQAPVPAWELEIPGTDNWQLGETGWWWDEDGESDGVTVFANGTDTLDARGERTISTLVPAGRETRASRVTVEATVTDVNRQTVGATSSVVVHPAAFYIAARPQGESWFWKEGEAQRIAIRAVRPDGTGEAGVQVRGTLVRREWHQVRRTREGMSQLVGEWVSDTVGRCTVTTATAAPPACVLTPRAGGMHMVLLEATDARGRRSATSFGRWVAGSGYVPWSDETQFKRDVIADRDRYSVGDTATVMLASPFTDAEAWVTVEREGIIEQRRMRLTSGSTTLKLPITEAYVPNAFVSVVVTRGRTAAPGKLDDPGRPTIRVGYAELRVTPEVKRLAVRVEPLAADYRPGDTARVRVAVRHNRNTGMRSEVTLWAVDEGVLSLTGYTTPDPIDLLYRARGLGMRLASNLVAVAPQVPDGEKGRRDAGGGGGGEAGDVLRSRFKTTAFFLGSVITDADGNAVASAALPENLTTFRVMAVAVTAGDRYGSGESKLLVTRPVVARPALPRFVRPGDQLIAGTVVNRRDGAASPVQVTAVAEGLRLEGSAQRSATLAAARGAEVRFRFRAQAGDSATFRFDVRSGADADAVRLRVPVKPDHHPRAHTIAGIVHDSATVEFRLPADIDPARSTLSLSLGSSPLAIIRGIRQDLRVYPYYCTEQVVSTAAPIVALLRAQRAAPGAIAALPAGARGEIERAVTIIARRQRPDGGIGYWGADDWSTPWLTAHAGHLLIDARELGIAVDSAVMERVAEYLRATLRGELGMGATPLAAWYASRQARLADQVASVDFLSRLGSPDVGGENELVRMAAQMSREDRIRLAETLQRRRATAQARALMQSAWADVRVEGRRAVLPESPDHLYFQSRLREEARLLTATLAIEPGHPLVGPLVETLVDRGRAAQGWMWNTQDQAFAVSALAAFERHQREAGTRTLRARSGNRVVWASRSGAATSTDTAVALNGLLAGSGAAERILRLSLDTQGSGTAPAYYYLTVREIPTTPPVRPDDAGIRVERWYETFEAGQPVTSVTEGDLVRVRLRVTVPAERHFVVLDDPLPAGLEAIDLSLRTASALPGPLAKSVDSAREEEPDDDSASWGHGRWDAGWWTPWEHREIRDDRVVYSATLLWPGVYTATYVARATTPGVFIRPPAHAEEMYNPAVQGRSDGGTFTVRERPPR